MSNDGRRYRHHRTPPHGYPIAQDHDRTRADGSPISFIDEISSVEKMPDEIREPFARALDSTPTKYHALVEPSRNELASLHAVTSRLHALVEDLGLPMLKDLLARADKIERSQQSAVAKLDAFIEHEFKPAKLILAKVPGLGAQVVTLEKDIEDLKIAFSASKDENRKSIDTLRNADIERARIVQRDFDMLAGERRITKKILWLASTSAGVLGMIIAKFGDQILKLIKGIL